MHTCTMMVLEKHMYAHAHVYNEAVGKKGANNVAPLIIKTLRQLNLLRDDSAGGELNIIFHSCSGQNKNNTVLTAYQLWCSRNRHYFTLW